MKIKYYTGIPDKQKADAKLFKVATALHNSKLPFIYDILPHYGTYQITVELKHDVFNTWQEMEDYVRKFVVAQNKDMHQSTDLIQLDIALTRLIKGDSK